MDSEYLRLSRRIKNNKEVSASYVADTLMPIGSMLMWTSDTLPSGWLLCDGAAVSRTTYEDLFESIGTTYGVGDNSTTFNLPNLKGKFPIGIDDSDTDCDALGETGGAKTHTLSESELPAHDHSIAHDHASATSGTQSASHTHYHNHGSFTSGNSSSTAGTSESIRTVTDDGTSQVWVMTGMNESNHTHSIDVPGKTSDNQSANHTHDVDLPNYTGDSGTSGSGSAHENMPPFLTVSFIINYRDVKIPFKGAAGERGNTGDAGEKGDSAPELQYQFSADGVGWHAAFTSGDQYIRFSTDSESSWGDAILFKGEKGDTGDTGATGAAGTNGTNGTDGADGADAPQVQSEYSTDNASWHGTYAAGDEYIRFSYDGGSTFGSGMLFKGVDGQGTGDVVAPASNTDEKFPQWDGSNTKTLKDGFTLSQLQLAMYPVGAIYTSVVSTSPATLFGGTWVAFGAGKALVGFQSGDSDFGTAEGTAGSKTHALTASELPSHSHTQNSHTHSINHDHASATSGSDGAHGHSIWWGQERPVSLSSGSKGTGNIYSSTGYRTGYASGSVYEWAMNAKSNGAHTHSVNLPSHSGTSGSATATNQTTGSGSAHTSIQPSITVYMWKRTA